VVARAVAEAEKALESGEKEVAESRYRTALFEGWLLLGSLAKELGELPQARTALERAIAAAVETRHARIPLAVVLAEMGQPEAAEAVLRSLIAEDKDDYEARRLLSQTLGDSGRLDEAVQELEQLVFLTRGEPQNAYLLATAYLKQERVEEADEILVRIAEALPRPQTHVLMGRTFRDTDQYERARRTLTTALEMDPEVPRAHYYLGTVDLLEQGRDLLDSAMAHFEQELQISPGDPMSSLYLGIALTERRRFAEAIPHLEVAGQLREVRADALRFLGQSLAAVGRAEEAVAAFRRGLETAESDIEEGPNGELPEAKALQLSSLHFQLGQALRRSGEREEAGFHFDAAKRYQARSTESARESLDRYLSGETETLGELDPLREEPPRPAFDEAQIAAVRSSLEETLSRAYFNLGVLKTKAGEPRRAADLLAQAVELDPEMRDGQYSLGVARFNAGQFDLATGPLSRARPARPGDAALEQMLALAWLNSEEYTRAAEALERLPKRSSDPRLEYAYGLALVRSGRAAEAEEVFRLLLQENTQWPELNVLLAQAHAQQGDFDAAVELLRRAIALDPAVAEAHGTLGEIHLRRGELEAAEAELRAELRSQPEDSRTMYTLATVLDLAQKPAAAKELLRTLLDAEPHLAKGRYLLGKILLAQGFPNEARQQLEAAAGLAPEDPNTHYQLGQAYQKLGLRDEARREFDTFRELKDERRRKEGR
jgi:tetratricopeptide (TPR) repeat protein